MDRIFDVGGVERWINRGSVVMDRPQRIGLLHDPHGALSTTRVMSFIALAMAAGLTISALATGRDVQIDVLIVWITAAFAPKVVQRFAERGTITKGAYNATQAGTVQINQTDSQTAPGRDGGMA